MNSERAPSPLYDELTGLPGAVLLDDRLQMALAGAMQSGHGVAVFIVDVDRPAQPASDRAIAHSAGCLKAATRPGETVARIGHGRFALVLSGFENAQQIVTRAQTLLAQLLQARTCGGQEPPTVGIGVAVFPRDATVPDELLRAATSAADAAQVSAGTVRYHASDMEARSLLRLGLESRLRRAMNRSELSLDYQPKVSLATSLVSGAEALLRWLDAERGAIVPSEFIPVAEETDLILGLGAWVIRRACATLRERSRLGVGDVPISVNVSVRQFFEQDVVELVRTALEETGVEPRLLHLEVTEGLFLRNDGRATHTLSVLKDMGVCLALDDFGTGYFSLRDLKNLPLDFLKIDSSFIRGMRGDDRDQAIVDSVVRMSHRLGFRVIAEGVETEWEATQLREMGCDEAQGYYFRRPMQEQEFGGLATAPISRRHASEREPLALRAS